MLKYLFVFALSPMLMGVHFLHGQSSSLSDLIKLRPVSEALSIHGCLGATGAIAYGKYIGDYQSVFHEVNDPEGEIQGGVMPMPWFSLGGEVGYHPFANAPLSSFSVSLGLLYYKRGFVNRYRAVIDPADLDYQDNTLFVESYHAHMLGIPFLLGWDQGQWFGQIGVSGERMLSGSRRHKLDRKVSGPDAYDGGFTTQARYRERLTSVLIDPRSGRSLILAGGRRMANDSALRLSLMVSPRTFYADPNFRNLIVHVQWMMPIM